MLIKQLDKDTIKSIKATQIIKSVYSAVKELVENSLDADAKCIEVNLTENGFKMIEVKDDGCGISKKDAAYMALPSYTSKIKDMKDIDFLTSYGFRGEGLNAICEVGEVSVLTKTSYDEIMTCYKLDSSGTIISMESIHGLTGTIVQVSNIFKNIPVRRNTLINKKESNKEIRNIELLLKNFAICQPKIRFTLRVNGKIIFNKLSCKTFLEAFQSIIGVHCFNKLECIHNSLEQVEIAIIVPKKNLQSTETVIQNGFQFICINDRPIISKLIEKIILKRIMEYYELTQKSLQKFIFCITLKVNPSKLDINLEPNKDKVFLHNENLIVDEIDKLLLKYYDLQSSQESIIGNNDENTDINTKSNFHSEPACKKRKISQSNADKIDINKEFLKNFNEPMLSESDDDDFAKEKNNLDSFDKDLSNMDLVNLQNQELNDLEKRNKSFETIDSFSSEIEPLCIQKQGSLEIINFSRLEQVKNTAETERLSQLPEVDLGEDFDMEDIFMNSHKILQKNKEETLVSSNYDNNKNNEQQEINLNSEITNNKPSNECSNAEENILRWSKGQIPGLKSGMILGNKKVLSNMSHLQSSDGDKHLNKSFELEEQQTSELFDYLKDVQEKLICSDDENSQNSNVNDVLKDFPEMAKFDWKEIKGKSGKNNTKALEKLSKNTPIKTKENKNEKNEIIPFAGDNCGFSKNSTSTFNKFCQEIRAEIMQENPNLSSVEIANEVNKRWRNLSSEERGYYRDLAREDLQSTCTPPPSQIKKSKPEISEDDKEKNKKKFVNMLENMKTKKRDSQPVLMRTGTPWDVSIQSVTEKFRKSPAKIKCTVIGQIHNPFWMINISSKIFICNLTVMLNSLTIEDKNIEINAFFVEKVLNKWMEQKNSYEGLHEIFDTSNEK